MHTPANTLALSHAHPHRPWRVRFFGIFVENCAMEEEAARVYDAFAVHDSKSWSDTWKGDARQSHNTNYGAYNDTLQDLRKSLDYMQDYRTSDEGQTQTSNYGENEFEGSREFRTIVNNNNYLGLPTWNNEEKTTHPGGAGTVAMFDAADAATIVMGTFSKSFGVSGGFVAADADVVDYLRYFARSYVFSTAPSTASAPIWSSDPRLWRGHMQTPNASHLWYWGH